MTISQALLDDVVVRLVREINPTKIYLFGSFAWGTPNEDSDLDLMIVVGESSLRSMERVMRARKALWGIPISRDVIVKTKSEFERLSQLQSSLEAEVLAKGRLLYG